MLRLEQLRTPLGRLGHGPKTILYSFACTILELCQHCLSLCRIGVGILGFLFFGGVIQYRVRIYALSIDRRPDIVAEEASWSTRRGFYAQIHQS